MTANITDDFIDELFVISQKEVSKRYLELLKICFFDYFGVTLAGAKIIREKANKLLDNLKTTDSIATVLGLKRKSNLANAALINGMSSHVAELDDGVRFGSVHPGAPVISALLPLVQTYGLSAQDLFRGIIVGYETTIRLACAIQPSHRNKGFHATGTCGTIGSALGAAAALGLDRKKFSNALSIACAGASGYLKMIKGSSELKPYNVGCAALSGLNAALTAQAGFNGPKDVLFGEWGILSVFANVIDESKLFKTEKEKYSIESVYRKPHASCRHCHPAIDAILKLKKNHTISHEEIQKIKVHTYNLAVGGHDHTDFENVQSAKMSTPYSVAIAFLFGKASINEFTDELINNPEVLQLSKKIEVVLDKEIDALVPVKRPAIVEVLTDHNKIYKMRIDLAKGEPENSMGIEEIKEKFRSLALFAGKTENEIREIVYLIDNIQTELKSLYEKLD